MKFMSKGVSLIFTLILILSGSTGCGGGGGSSSDTETAVVKQGVFLDSAVQGIAYFSGKQSGVTDAEGVFFFEEGKTVQLLIGSILLGEGNARSIMTPMDLVPGATDPSNAEVLNISRFLQTLDKDSNTENGITISDEVFEAALGQSVDFAVSTEEFENDPDVNAVVEALTTLNDAGKQPLVAIVVAKEHLETVMLKNNISVDASASESNAEPNGEVVSVSSNSTTTTTTFTTTTTVAESTTTTSTSTTTSTTTTTTTTTSTSTTTSTTTTTTSTSTTTSTTTTTITTSQISSDLSVSALTTPSFQQVSGGWVSAEGSFTIPSNAVSFLIHSFRDGVKFNTVVNPQGTDMLDVNSLFQDCGASQKTCNVLVPKHPDISSMAGTWKYRLQHSRQVSEAQVKLTLRTGSVSSSILVIQPFLTGTKYSSSDIQSALSTLEQIYEKVGIQIVMESVEVVSGSQFAVISSDFENSTVKTLVSKGYANKVNLFFVEDFSGTSSGVLGIAAGIPGSLGVTGNKNGVLIGLDAHVVFFSLHSSLLGETAAHEMGHWLGLFHTTEQNGTSFDILADTPECPISRASNLQRGVQPSDCLNFGGENLMFWQGDITLDQTNLTSDQIHVISYSPIAQ
ncbi:MAG: hypothetical protein HQM14_16675 [SAR324 cluster bacterium]|nr:hypothetical protein [SAR324 cluster bacterium]